MVLRSAAESNELRPNNPASRSVAAEGSRISVHFVTKRSHSQPTHRRAQCYFSARVPDLADEWLWGWDDTPGIVSVHASADGQATVWRRDPRDERLLREEERFRPWLVVDSLAYFEHLGPRLTREGQPAPPHGVSYQELNGPSPLRFLMRAEDGRTLTNAILRGARQRLGRVIAHVRELGEQSLLSLSPEEQYLVATGRTYFKGLGFEQVARLQFDLETTGLDPREHRIFLIALRDPRGNTEILSVRSDTDAAERELIEQLCARIRAHDPDVIENHNLHGFDLPFVVERARRLGVPLFLSRTGEPGVSQRPAARGASFARGPTEANDKLRRKRYTVPGRELIDSLDAVRRHDFSARDLPGHGLKAVARHFGLASAAREYLPGARVYQTFLEDPARVRHYASDDVQEAADLGRLLGGAAFALARMAPRRYERLADAGAATGVIDPLLIRAYLRAGESIPVHEPGDGTEHSGAALHLFASGVAERIVKADVASLYPSLMRQYQIGPERDRLGAMLSMVGQLVEQRLAAKARSRAAAPGSSEQFSEEALSAAMKLVINSAYGYLGAVGLTRFADVHAANEVTRRGREVLTLLCRELAARGVQLLEADTDGVYFAVPAHFDEADERRVVSEVAALLPPLVKLEFDGRYAAMLSHEPKNYALKPYDGALLLRGVAFRSSRAQPFGEEFLRRAIDRLLDGDLAGVRLAYVQTVLALRKKQLETRAVCSRVRLTKTPAQYAVTRRELQELPYEALLQNGREHWSVGEHVYVYRRALGRAGLWAEPSEEDRETGAAEAASGPVLDAREYDAEYYVRQLGSAFASRLARGVTAEDFGAIVADPDRPSLFARTLSGAKPILSVLPDPMERC